MSTASSSEAWPGWDGYVWRAARPILPLCVVCTLLVAASVVLQNSGSTSRTLAGFGAIFLNINCVIAIFWPMIIALRYGVWGLRPLDRSVITLTLVGWLTTALACLGTLIAFSMLTGIGLTSGKP